MSHILTDLGEEFAVKNGVIGSGFTVGLYNDSVNNIADTSDLASITTKPAGAAYADQAATLEAASGDVDDGNWRGHANAAIVFDTSDSTGNVDSYFIAATFQAVETGDASPTPHLLSTGALSQTRDLSQIDTLTLPIGSVGIKLT